MKDSERLDSWKDIAAYVHREVRTVRRWEVEEGLPVHRIHHGRGDSVYACRSEIDSWLEARDAPDRVHRPKRVGRIVSGWAIAAGALVLGLAGVVTLWITYGRGTGVTIWTTTALTAQPGQALEPALSPTGNQIAYTWNGPSEDNFDIYTRLIAEGPPLRLTSAPEAEYSPAWSPDGSHLAFLRASGPHGAARVVIIPALGGAERAIAEIYSQPWFTGFAAGPHLTWSRDARWLVVVARADPNSPVHLMRLSADSGEMIPLTDPHPPERGDTAAAISPDGRQLAFIRHHGWGTAKLYVLPLTADCEPIGPPRLLETGHQWNASPVWMPDGREIVVSAGTLFSVNLVAVAAKGGSSRRLAGVPDRAWFPSASGTSQKVRIVFSERVETINLWRRELRAAREHPSAKLRLLASTRRDFNPQYSPDGSRIAFNSDRNGQPEVWVADRDGANARMWTSSPGFMLGGAEWSPDGSGILYARVNGRESEIAVVGAPGANPIIVHRTRGSVWGLLWSSCGKHVYFSGDQPAGGWRVPVSGGPAEQVAAQPLQSIAFSPDGRFRFELRNDGGTQHLWRVSLDDGDQRQIAENVGEVEFRKSGIYISHFDHRDQYRTPSCIFYQRYGSNTEEPLFCLDTAIRFRFAVSPDERYILYSRPEFEASNLMMAESSAAATQSQ